MPRSSRHAGYEVRFSTRQEDPAATPVEELPHLVVIGGEAGDGDLSAIASAWTNSPYRRPGAVVLVETLRPVDRLRAIAAGVDAVFPVEQVEQKLPRYARTFARIGPPPSSVLLAHHDPTLVAPHISALEQAHVRVTRCLPAHAILDTLERELPDLLLMETRLPGSDGFALARMVQQDPRFHLLPIVFIGEESTADRLSALKAGADDFFPSSASSELLVQMVIAHATRGRRLREMVHRDGLTGLLNHATLMAELESAVDFSQRHGEPLAFVLFELDGFRRLSERLGPRAGEEILLHVASVFRSNVRASDIIGRYGWEAFGMLLRGSSASGAAVLTEKLHHVLGEQPAKTSGGEVIPLPVRLARPYFPGMGPRRLSWRRRRTGRYGGEAGKRGSNRQIKDPPVAEGSFVTLPRFSRFPALMPKPTRQRQHVSRVFLVPKEEPALPEGGAPESEGEYFAQLLNQEHLDPVANFLGQILQIRLVFLRQE